MKKKIEDKKTLVKKEIKDLVPEQLTLPFIKEDEVPLFLRASRLQLFAATNRIITEPLVVQESYANNTKVRFIVKCASEVNDEGKQVNIGRLNDFDYRIWTIIKKQAMENISFNFKVHITLYYILKELGHKKPGGRDKKNVLRSIERLSQCQTKLLITGAKGQKFIQNKGSYLSGYEFFDRGKVKGKKYEKKNSFVVINTLFADEITKERITKLNYDVFRNLTKPLSRWLHKTLSSYNRQIVIFDLPYIRNRTGQVSTRVREVEKAAEELVFSNFIETFTTQYIKKGKTKIAQFIFVKKETPIYKDYMKQLEDVRKTDPFYYIIMKNLKVNYESAKQLIEEGITDEQENKVIKLLKLMRYYQLKGKQIKNPAGWVISGIREIRTGPKEFEEAWAKNMAEDLVPNDLFM